jgi:hypothetical protein
MEELDIALVPPTRVNREEIHVSWTTAWTLERYVGWYLETRKHPLNDEWRFAVLDMLKAFPATGPMRKTDVDFFLDTNAPRWAPVWMRNLEG